MSSCPGGGFALRDKTRKQEDPTSSVASTLAPSQGKEA